MLIKFHMMCYKCVFECSIEDQVTRVEVEVEVVVEVKVKVKVICRCSEVNLRFCTHHAGVYYN